IKQAKMKPLKKIAWADVQSAVGASQLKILKLYVPEKQKKTEMIEGPPGEVAKQLVEKMRNELRVL
ncbi:MAG: electron transfer flavoprotein subunit beta, partial [Acidobacteriaceae bacterium]